MFQEREVITLTNSVYYSQKIIVPESTIEVWKFDTINNEKDFKLERSNIVGASLFNNQFSVDEDRGLFLFPSNLVGSTLEILYFTDSNDNNPFNTASNLFTITDRILNWANNRITDGIFLFKATFDEYYIQRIKEGAFVYNGSYYTLNETPIDFRTYGIPSIRNKYKAVKLFLNSSTISNFVSNRTKQLSNVGILVSTGTHENQTFAKNDVDAKYSSTYGNEFSLDIAYVYILVDQNNTVNYWFEYPKNSRLL